MRVNPGIAERATDAVEFAWRGLKELAMHVERGSAPALELVSRMWRESTCLEKCSIAFTGAFFASNALLGIESQLTRFCFVSALVCGDLSRM
jgi:hypothetical protein